jgi:hypothetical protein
MLQPCRRLHETVELFMPFRIFHRYTFSLTSTGPATVPEEYSRMRLVKKPMFRGWI